MNRKFESAKFNGQPCRIVKEYPGKKTGALVAVVQFIDGYAGAEGAFPVWSKESHVMKHNLTTN